MQAARVWVFRVVVALWFCSALTQLHEQKHGLLHQPPHPGIPFDDPEAVLSLLRGCEQQLRSGDALAVLSPDDSALHAFEFYRLAYLRYPATVEARRYDGGTADGLSTAVTEALLHHPTHLLVLGPAPPLLPGASAIAHFGPEAHLYRVARNGER